MGLGERVLSVGRRVRGAIGLLEVLHQMACHLGRAAAQISSPVRGPWEGLLYWKMQEKQALLEVTTTKVCALQPHFEHLLHAARLEISFPSVPRHGTFACVNEYPLDGP